MQPLDLADYTAPGHFPGFVSLVLVVLTSLAIAGLGIFARTLARRYRYRAFVAERSVSAPDEPLDVGFRVLSGDVEVDGPEPAIVVTVEQRGTEASNKGNWSFSDQMCGPDGIPLWTTSPNGISATLIAVDRKGCIGFQVSSNDGTDQLTLSANGIINVNVIPNTLSSVREGLYDTPEKFEAALSRMADHIRFS